MYQRILVPLDGSATAQRGLEEAIRLATLTQGRLRVIHVIDELSFALAMDAYAGHAGDWLSVLREDGQRLLAQAKAAANAAGVEADTVLYDRRSGRVHELVTGETAKWPADLIVLGTHGRRGAGRVIMGSSAEHILRTAPVPVLLVRAPETEFRPQPGEPAHASQPTGAPAFE
ncbi:Putative universal stress protein [Variovorax sp. PBS-H4]|uniref:universal stress protein n=1 Tax=Variovorax sp. PBS-H4 TaxID=434008 RepID=UPI0013178BB9|nr:universal stress protein [Variovorax sp. PBS-H4]VTU36341.1 Putative universal stress protein [Variovorax sp. PBS-H4]